MTDASPLMAQNDEAEGPSALEDRRAETRDDASHRLRAIAIEISALQAKFDRNVLDATRAWSKHVVDEAKLSGIGRQAIERARQSARAHELDGFRLTLDAPTYEAVMCHAKDRELRHEIYEAYTTQASDRGPNAGRFDNGPLIEEILELRHEAAKLLGLRSHADRMAKARIGTSADDVERFLLELNARVRPRAQAELDDVWALAKSRDGIKGFRPWDLPYYCEKSQADKRGFSEEDWSTHFAGPLVPERIAPLIEDLYGLRVEPAHDIRVWQDASAYRLRKASGSWVANLYVDPYARDQKRGGAWIARSAHGARPTLLHSTVEVFVYCNLAPPSPGQPLLLTREELRTLVHAWGVALYDVSAMIASPDSAAEGADGNEPVDAADLSGCFLVNAFCADAAKSVHAEPLPAAILDGLSTVGASRSALAMLHEIERALFDLRVHRDYVPSERASRLRSQVLDAFAQARRQVTLLPPPPWDRSACSFMDAFGPGAGGYYVRTWARVLSADLCTSLKDADFREKVLAKGRRVRLGDLFVELRGRAPTADALHLQDGPLLGIVSKTG